MIIWFMIKFDIWLLYYVIWYDMIWFDMIWYDMMIWFMTHMIDDIWYYDKWFRYVWYESGNYIFDLREICVHPEDIDIWYDINIFYN